MHPQTIVLGYPSVPVRPSYAPSSSGILISQLIPPGKPWPANPEDYSSFSETFQRPNYTPIWATTTTKTFTIKPNEELKPVDNWHWARPSIVFHIARNETPPPINSGELLTTTQINIAQTEEIKEELVTPAPIELLNPESSTAKEGSFTSPPVRSGFKPCVKDEAKIEGISVANLLPDRVFIDKVETENIAVADLLPNVDESTEVPSLSVANLLPDGEVVVPKRSREVNAGYFHKYSRVVRMPLN